MTASITWKETYPIYDFISDPIKKKEIKVAVMRHIEASSFNVWKLLPLYTYYCEGKNSMNHCVTTNPDISINFPSFSFLQVEGYIFKEQIPETVPLYEYYYDAVNSVTDHYTSTRPDIPELYPGWVRLAHSVSGYIYPAD